LGELVKKMGLCYNMGKSYPKYKREVDIIMMNITVIGLGRTAQAAAAYLTEKGCAVTMWGRNEAVAKQLQSEGVEVAGAINGHFEPKVCLSLAEAVKGAQVLLVTTLSAGHAPVARQLKGLLEQGQKILIFNGNWGAYEFASILGDEAKEKGVEICETGAQIFLANFDGKICRVSGIKKEITLACATPKNSLAVCEALKEIFPQFVPAENVISTSLNTSNPVIHAPVALFNITRMENGEDYHFYGEGASRAIFKAVESIDAERCAVIRAMGAEPMGVLDIINSFWVDQYDNLYDAFKNNKSYMAVKGPQILDHRFLTEDMPFGIAPIAALGKLYGVPTPCVDGLMACFNMLIGIDCASIMPKFELAELEKLMAAK